jgi:hypothetical protein
MQKQRRWLKAAIIASAVPQPPMPWHRGQRRQPTIIRGLATLAIRQLPQTQR